MRLSRILSEAMRLADEEPHLYYQPTPSVRLVYPCCVYHLKSMPARYADDTPYFSWLTFDVTYMTRNSASSFPTLLQQSKDFSFDRYYTADGLHHYAFIYTATSKEV